MKSEFSPFVFIRKSTSGLLLSPGRFFCREAKSGALGSRFGPDVRFGPGVDGSRPHDETTGIPVAQRLYLVL